MEPFTALERAVSRPPVHGAALEAYLAYYGQLAAERRELRGATVLHSPGSPLLGANAAYAEDEEGLTRAALWLHARGAPALFASARPLTGRAVLSLTLGRYRRTADPSSETLVEQVSGQHLALTARLLAEGWDLPDWAPALNLTLGRALEGRRDAIWLVAYAGGEPVGTLLLLGEAAHLWGVTRPKALAPLLDAAAELAGGAVETSLPEGWTLPLTASSPLHFHLGRSPLDALN